MSHFLSSSRWAPSLHGSSPFLGLFLGFVCLFYYLSPWVPTLLTVGSHPSSQACQASGPSLPETSAGVRVLTPPQAFSWKISAEFLQVLAPLCVRG